ncbi:hypothetical protein DFH09DRAFT_1079606 [Mycena vulgaris]|nr:hypothetical protein DFH09DRAFT_1079606 [Mycena vulgaris]
MPHPTFEMQFQAQFNLSWLWCSSCIEKQTVKRDKDTCIDMMEQIQWLLYSIIQVHIESHTGGELSPDMLYNLGKFTQLDFLSPSSISFLNAMVDRTLHKVHSFMEAHQDKGKIRLLFRQGELSALLKGCRLGLDEALEVFKASFVFPPTLKDSSNPNFIGSGCSSAE